MILQRVGSSIVPLGVASINLDHVHHFGRRDAWAGSLGGSIEWLNLIDGPLIAAAAKRLSGTTWPRLAGSDLIDPILDRAETQGIWVGFLGGSEQAVKALRSTLARERPGLLVAGLWYPSQAEITDPRHSRIARR